MDMLSYKFGLQLPAAISTKLNNVYDAPSWEQQQDWFLSDAFYANGIPKKRDVHTLSPIYSATYLKQMLPSSLLEIHPGYSQTACIAAIKWLKKNFIAASVNDLFDGIAFRETVNGKTYDFLFPAVTVSYRKGASKKHAAVVAIADTRSNDTYWEDSIIPAYADSAARFLLWCWAKIEGKVKNCPTECLLVRITGNTPGDIMVRTVHSDPPREDVLVKKICAGFDRFWAKGTDPVTSPTIKQQASWCEIKREEETSANVVDDPDFYNLVKQALTLHTIRKEKEAASKELFNQEKATAIHLASFTSLDAVCGTLDDPFSTEGHQYTVRHNPKQKKSTSISASFLRQYFPEYGDCIVTNITARGRISIDDR